MSLGISSRLKHPKKHELVKSHSQAQILANKLRQDGVMGTVESVLQAVDQVAAVLASNISESNIPYKDSIINLCQHLKVYGAYLEILYKEQLDHAFKIFRDKAQDHERTDPLSRLHLLELIELRAKGWKGTEVMNQYYRKKVNQYSQIDMSESVTSMSESMSSMAMSSASPPLLAPGEVLKPSGKFNKPTRIPGKKYCKDEVVIRNADSGKVMGIKGRRVHMIEELSETIISFQRACFTMPKNCNAYVLTAFQNVRSSLFFEKEEKFLEKFRSSNFESKSLVGRHWTHCYMYFNVKEKVNPGAKERLVQITGANEESINHAKQLIEDTIRRNASPVREHGMAMGGPLTGSSSSINSSASDDSALPSSARMSRMLKHSLSTNDANIGEYKYSVVVNGSMIKITGDDLDIVRTSKLVLDEYFSGTPINTEIYSFNSLPQPVEICNDSRPLSPPESLPSPGILTNGQVDEPDGKPNMLRKPHMSLEDIMKGKTTTTTTEQGTNKINNLVYTIEFLANLAMSPLCLSAPLDWDRISKEYPCLIRNTVESFDAKQYLSTRTVEPTSVLSVDEVDFADV